MNITTEQLFTAARTQNGYLDAAVPDEQLQALYELLALVDAMRGGRSRDRNLAKQALMERIR